MNLDEFLLSLPAPALRKVFSFLRRSELRALAIAFPCISQLCENEQELILREFTFKHHLKWNRCSNDEQLEVMAERHKHCIAYFEPEDAFYAFGGEALNVDRNREQGSSRHASFNDLWKFDMATLKWHRVIVRTAPYPLPKCSASLVVWKDELVLFGGYRPFPSGSHLLSNATQNQSEVHSYNPKLNSWRRITTLNQGPALSGHSAVVSKNLMIVYGGWTPHQEQTSTVCLYVLDLEHEHWHTVKLHFSAQELQPYEVAQQDSKPDDPFFPSMHPTKSQLVLIRNGLVLIVGEMKKFDYGSGILVEFNPDRPESTEWKWKRIETSGRWWNPRTRRDDSGRLEALSNCAMPNSKFFEVAAVRSGKAMRLVSLGRIQGDHYITRSNHTTLYDAYQQRTTVFLRAMRDHVEKGIISRQKLLEYNTGTEFTFEGTTCILDNCYLSRQDIQQSKNVSTIHAVCHVCLTSSSFDKWKDIIFDDVDLYELRYLIKAVIIQLQTKYYLNRSEEIVCPRYTVRQRSLRRFSIFVANIDVFIDDVEAFDKIEHIKWEPQPIQFRAAPETTDYCLVAARDEVLLHGGCCEHNEQICMMGYTYLLTPTQSAPVVDIQNTRSNLFSST